MTPFERFEAGRLRGVILQKAIITTREVVEQHDIAESLKDEHVIVKKQAALLRDEAEQRIIELATLLEKHFGISA